MTPIPTRHRLPLWTKILYTAFMAVLVPKYWHDYGPTNFLYFCDVALFLALAAMWLENPLLASMPLVGILLPQLVWQVDFLAGLVGRPVIGMTDYMFSQDIPLFTRGLSFFHFWLPLLLIWVVWRLGYDRRAFLGWTVVALTLIPVCYFFMPPPPRIGTPPANINYVYGLSDQHPQTWMPPLAYLAGMMVVMPMAIFLPTHLVLRYVFPSADNLVLARRASEGDPLAGASG